MTNTRNYTIALLTVLTYGRSFSYMSDPAGNRQVMEFERTCVFVPRGEEPVEVRPITDEERLHIGEAVEAGVIPFLPTSYVEFKRAFLFGGEGNEPMMFGGGFGIYVADGDGQPTDTKESNDITYALASLLFGRGGYEYDGLEKAEAPLTLQEARFCFAQTMEAVQNSIKHMTRAKVAEQQREVLKWGTELAQQMASKYVGDVFGEDYSYLFVEDEPATAQIEA